MIIEKLKAAGFIETVYREQEGVFWKKTLKARDMPYVREHLVGTAVAGVDIDDDDECFVEVVSGSEVQMGIPSVDYYEELVPVDSDEGRGLLRDAGVAI